MNALRRFSFSNPSKVAANISNQCQRLMATESVTERPKIERSINRVTLLGRVGREAEYRGTPENPCSVFSLATNLVYKKSSTGEYLTKTEWHRICAFRPKLIQQASTLTKGDRIHVEGSLSYHAYVDEDNKTRFVTSIIADDIIFLVRKNLREAVEEEENF